MHKLKIKKHAFTLAETVIVCSVFAMMVVGIILMINRGFLFMNNTKVLVRATNLAREGVEMVYNIRDTNRRRCSGDRDKARLYTGGSKNCNEIGEADMFKKGIYLIKEGKNSNDDSYIYADYLTGDSDDFYSIDGFFDENNQTYREKSKIEFSGEYSYYSGGEIVTGNLEDLLGGTGIEFYRLLRVYGVYCKNSSSPDDLLSCQNDSAPKEMRFCVKIFYEFNGGHHASELCSIMTNFME